ncbi:MAG: nucleoid occlusion protein, partial [Clostridia bacterium]|nr:nucleoid occlusion protein [Clostridia bacterium]
RERIVGAGLSQRHARALLQLTDENQRNDVLLKVIADQLTVAQTEQLIHQQLVSQVPAPSAPKLKAIIVDVRLFANTIQHAVSTMQKSGVNARSEKIENESFIQYTILIPKAIPDDRLIELG